MAEVDEEGRPLVTRAQIIGYYNQFLGRPPEDEGAIIGRLGRAAQVVRDEIFNSQEAQNRRAAIGPIGPTGPQGPITQPTTQLGPIDVAKQIGGAILDAANAAFNPVGTVARDVGAQIAGQANDTNAIIGAIASALQKQVGDLTKTLIPSTLSLIGAALGGVESLISTFLANAADLGDIGDLFEMLFKNNAPNIFEFVGTLGEKIFEEGIQSAFHGLEQEGMPALSPILSMLQGEESLSPELRNIFGEMKSASAPFWLLPLTILFGGVLSQAAQTAFYPQLRGFDLKQHYQNPIEPVSPDVAALLTKRGDVGEQEGQEIAKLSGVNPLMFSYLTDSHTTNPGPAEVIAARMRGAIIDETYRQLMRRTQLTDGGVQVMEALARIIPPPSDLITMAVKGAFSEEETRTFQTDENYPAELKEWGEKQGLDEFWSRRYWRSHWTLPSPNQVFEMLHRGKITENVMDIYLRAADYSVFWREALKGISYNPLTRVDTRRLYRDEIISFTEMEQSYRDQGYDAQKAGWLAEWTHNDLLRGKKDELKDVTDALRSTIISGVVAGSISEALAREYLESFGYTGPQVDDFVALARLLRGERIAARTLELLGDLYVKGRATVEEVQAGLVERGFDSSEITARLEEWDTEKELRAPNEAQEKERDLTKAEIIDSYKEGVSTREETISDLTAMKYDAREVERLIALADNDIAKVIEKEEIEIVKNLVLKGRLSETDATTRLDGLHLRPSQRDSLVSSWIRQIEGSAFDIPLSTLQSWLEREIRTPEETLDVLRKRGVNERDATDLVALWDAKYREKIAREERAAANVAAKAAAATKK